MKKILYALLFMVSGALAQTAALPGDFLNADKRIPTVPQSPEVAAFEKYGSLPVNLYGGTPSIAIPIYTFQGHEMSLPISLTYDASGIKVDQLASNVGLGWNLNFGGVVSRNVQGQADFNILGSSSYSHVASTVTKGILEGIYTSGFDQVFGSGHGNLRRNIYNKYKGGLIDLQADTFSFNVNGLSGTIIIDYNKPIGNTYEVYCVENPDIEAEFIGLDAWKITGTDGTSYFFSKAEKTEQDYSALGTTGLEYTSVYSSAWYLTKIVSPNGLDIFEFTYSTGVYWTTYDTRTRNHETQMNYFTDCKGRWTTDPEILAYSRNRKEQFHLTGILYNGVSVLTTQVNNEISYPRADLTGMRYLDQLTIKNEFTDPLLIVDFDNHHYFKKQNGQVNDQNNSRLKLESVSFYRTAGTTNKKTYSFSYIDPDDMPTRNSNAVDYWGYCNGIGADGGSLIPDTTEFPFNVSGIDRTSNFFYTKRGTMETITYPTGGKTTFIYEPHSTITNTAAPNGVVGGLRIARQETETMDASGANNKQIKYYYYGDIVADVGGNPAAITAVVAGGTGDSSGIPQQDILFTQAKLIKNVVNACNANDTSYKFYQHSNNRAVRVPNAITYSDVSEVIFNGDDFLGVTVNKFYNELYDGGQGLATRPFYNTSLLNGELKEQYIYDSDLNMLQSSLNTYENTFLDVPYGFAEYNGVYMYVLDGEFENEPYTMGSACSSPSQNASFSFYPATWQACGVAGGNHEPSANNYTVRKYSYFQYHKKLLSSVNKKFESNATLEQITDYTYLPVPTIGDTLLRPVHFFPIEIESTDSKGKVNKTEITYVSDVMGTPNAIMDTLIGRNQIAEPVEVKKFYDTTLISKQKKIFTVAGNSNLGGSFNKDIIRPSSIEVAKANDAYETRRVYHAYDSHGNLTEVSQQDGSRTYYIWGYDGKLLLAEIRNKPSGSIPLALETLIAAAQTTSDTENSSGEENTLRTQLESIRNHSYFGASMMTSFTYDPGKGVTSVTDPRSYVMYYEYDQHNRLKRVRDADNNLVGENQYNYRINN